MADEVTWEVASTNQWGFPVIKYTKGDRWVLVAMRDGDDPATIAPTVSFGAENPDVSAPPAAPSSS